MKAAAICLMALVGGAVHAGVKFGDYDGDARQLVPAVVPQQQSEVKYNAYSNHAYGQYVLGHKDARKASGSYKSVNFGISVFNAANGTYQANCNSPDSRKVYQGDMSRCALEYSMIGQATLHFEPGKMKLTAQGVPMERQFLRTTISKAEYNLFRKPARKGSVASYHILEYMDKTHDSCTLMYMVHAGNVFIEMMASGCKGEQQQAAYDLANDVLAKLPRTGELDGVAAVEEAPAAPAADEGPRFEAFALPSLAGGPESHVAYLPASKRLPARLVAKTKPGTAVTFAIRNGKDGLLQAGGEKGQQLGVKADKRGIAEVLFFYAGCPVSAPLAYEVQVAKPGEKDTLVVNVGLGLSFEKIKAVTGDMRDTYPFTLTVKSRFHPQLRIGNYLTAAKDTGLWGGLTLGVRLGATWVNNTTGAPPDQAFRGTTTISDTPEGENLLVVAHNEAAGQPQYYLTQRLYPAVVMKSDGRHAYRIDGELALLDASGKAVGGLEEALVQSDVLAIVARDLPEHWLTSLACSLEVGSTEQYVMLETAKMLPVGGTAVELLTSATGLACKFGQGEYESLFYDLGTILGGKYLDHLLEPGVFDKLTPKQQDAVQVAKRAYDKLDDHKQDQEREKWLKSPVSMPKPAEVAVGTAEPPAPDSAADLGKNLGNLGKSLENELGKSAGEIGKSVRELEGVLKGIFKSK